MKNPRILGTVQLNLHVVPVITALLHADVVKNVVLKKPSLSERIGVELSKDMSSRQYTIFVFGLGVSGRTDLARILSGWQECLAGYIWAPRIRKRSYSQATKFHYEGRDPKEPAVEVRPMIIGRIRNCRCGHNNVHMPWSKADPTKVRCIHCQRLHKVPVPKVQDLIYHELRTR